ncbi:Lysosomal thioesterase [Wickerhamomyces ciferrii]|uniref:Palmitoyl-protein thioesterase 1 n=1 Tax=Wickerhamomyces ciferrii (strain ATCC 14091 / BCRC 22168 / CBS 111 / JCM 3599 / NBRC 0793 / NRRL Y-1031 F-60-10) TaxID=1206466 RepID=K0KQR1_WICCF|nr:Lysosomal thioesterase [Wickerhamomyces ciferrii]CCH43603.1 Lysosomal thioesterase [Wickerhamomyces ciferrii]
MFVLKLITEALLASPLITHEKSDSRPVVFWHGMGDTYNSSAMQRVFSALHSVKPELSIYSVYIDEDQSKDQQASLIGNVNEQVEIVCDQLNSIIELQDQKFDFIGFSQGGIFARAAIERCGLNVNNLITFGSPHSGVSDLPRCSDSDWFCKQKNALLKRQVWKKNIQNSIVSAQYFRDPLDYESYLENSAFLVDVNNELPNEKNETYIENLESLNKLVLIMFGQDETVVPKESAWFYDQDKQTGDTINFPNTEYYTKDLLGLKKLFDERKIDYLTIDDVHMAIGDDFLKKVTETYLGH